ncbi:TonB-dependent receptor [Mucilaginibacter limnophilus]|uniref:TonB-dependent receptor n=1 Tax=Mucilaginibacter limnophilus TaxID=1932778 RepID=A0A3S2UNM3_9SPHI|nr:TonB-dependent receptor [Mucilaginibacter limnophilus]RVU02903.1 TonB-dependent receptor [Mucilaginibacter limnophilus]
MMKRYLLLLMILFPFCVAAQQLTISGTVTDSANVSLPGVSVSVKTAKGVQGLMATDVNGAYKVNVPANADELIFAFVGMQTVTEKINGRTTINIKLGGSSGQLDEVVVVAYGTQKKETLTGAITNIRTADIQTTQNVSLAQKLSGKLAGLNIRQTEGEPGNFQNSINVRGFGQPLIVIDGVPRNDPGDFQKLNGNDIESITVLKDASAAIYGLNGANGVILVTTRRGTKQRTEFNYNLVTGISSPTEMPKMSTAAQWAQIRNDAEIYKRGGGAPFYSKEELQKYIDGAPGYENTDWYALTMKDHSNTSQHTLSATGGSEKVQYYTSLGYLNEGGLLRTNNMGYKQYNFRSNLTANLVKNLKADFLVAGRYDKKTAPGGGFLWIFKGTRVSLPTDRPYANNNPDYPGATYLESNPIALSDPDNVGYINSENRNINTTFSLTYTVPKVDGLSLKVLGTYDFNSFQEKDLYKSYKLYRYIDEEYVPYTIRNGSAGLSNSFRNSDQLSLQASINYTKKIAQHNIGAVLVFEQQQYNNRFAYLSRNYSFFTNDQINSLPRGTNPDAIRGIEAKSATQSYAGRVNYNFNEKYLVEFAFRKDGDYRYNPDKRWDFFPVVSAGYRISEESFFKKALPFVSSLKLRGSYGIVGGNLGDPFQYLEGFTTTGGGSYEFTEGSITSGAASPAIVNRNLTWTRSKVTDFGIDLSLFNNTLDITADVYQRDRSGLLGKRNGTLPNTFGGTLPEENLNSDRIRGIDLSISYRNRINDFEYGISGNVNYNRSMNLYVEQEQATNSMVKWTNRQGYRYNDVTWGYVYDRQFESAEDILQSPFQSEFLYPGSFKYKDINGDNIINSEDMQPIFYNSNPKFNFGLTLRAAYKGFDLNVLLQGAAKYTIRFSEIYGEVMAFRGNTPDYFFDRWHQADPYDPNSAWIPGKWPVSRFNADAGSDIWESDRWRRDASYVRIKSVELGYTFKQQLLQKAGIKTLRVYVNGFNLYTFADSFVKPFDPEKAAGAYNAGYGYPLTKIFNFGANINF